MWQSSLENEIKLSTKWKERKGELRKKRNPFFLFCYSRRVDSSLHDDSKAKQITHLLAEGKKCSLESS